MDFNLSNHTLSFVVNSFCIFWQTLIIGRQKRVTFKSKLTTQVEHMPKRLQAVQHIRSPDYGDYLLQQAREIGPNA